MKHKKSIYRWIVVSAGILAVTAHILISGHALTMLSYFTVQSNVLCIVVFAVVNMREAQSGNKGKRALQIWKGAATQCILLTFVVYHFMLRPFLIGTPAGAFDVSNVLVHYVMPFLVFADYLIFDEKGNYKAVDPFLWMGMPLFYLLYTVVYRAFGGVYHEITGAIVRFPYFFLDYETYGWSIAPWLLAVVVGFLFLSYISVAIDKIWSMIKFQKRSETFKWSK